jgi:hypothetical protein
MRLATATLFLATLFTTGCEPSQKRLPNALGGQGEVLVVMHQGHWDSGPGTAVRSFLEQPIAGLPQREARFKIAHTTPEGFGQLLSSHHNVLKAVIEPGLDTTGVLRFRDRLARGQLLVQINARDPMEWMMLLEDGAADLLTLFEEHQRRRIISRLAAQRDAALVTGLQERHSLTIEVPAGYRMMRETNDFVWLQRDRLMAGSGLEHNVIEGLLIYHYPYTSESTFNVPNLVDVRDNVTEMHVEGPVEGSHMIVQRGFDEIDLMPASRATELNGRFAYLMHGLFGMHGAKMGGPFVSLTTIDEVRGRVVTVEGFTYAPQFDKREYMRELEAILFTLRFPEGS